MITQIQVPWRLWMKACFISVGDGDRLFVAVTEGGAFDVTKAADGAASFGGFDTVETEVLGFEDPAVVTDFGVAIEGNFTTLFGEEGHARSCSCAEFNHFSIHAFVSRYQAGG